MAWAYEKGGYLLENVQFHEELFPLVVERLLSPKAVVQVVQFLDAPAAAFGQERTLLTSERQPGVVVL